MLNLFQHLILFLLNTKSSNHRNALRRYSIKSLIDPSASILRQAQQAQLSERNLLNL